MNYLERGAGLSDFSSCSTMGAGIVFCCHLHTVLLLLVVLQKTPLGKSESIIKSNWMSQGTRWMAGAGCSAAGIPVAWWEGSQPRRVQRWGLWRAGSRRGRTLCTVGKSRN